ncbi:RNA polymerase sigma factor [Streptomyces sp. 142MFCol3.1]|uniref:RNA polymerase sigma factor n=1 Tax=Streptomyces sp. 142MFCol3.1 TaxID=1172179 RepID=UPI0003F98353|nr:RNA polymerase sigma factor [Streptomyces sp. 142MFCol3.1]
MGVSSSAGPEAHPPSEDSPTDLVELFEKTVGISFEEAVPIVYAKARALSRHDPAAANDLAQDVWEHIYTLLSNGRLHQTVDYPAAWLRHLTQTQWLQRRRRDSAAKRGGHLFIESLEQNREAGHEPASTAAGPETAAVQMDLEERLHAATGRLPRHLRDVVTLVLKGHTHAEIAALLRISSNTSKTRLRAALELLRGHPGLAAN